MEEKNLTSLVITIVVALIVTGAVLVPIINGLSGDNSEISGETITNDGNRDVFFLSAENGRNYDLYMIEDENYDNGYYFSYSENADTDSSAIKWTINSSAWVRIFADGWYGDADGEKFSIYPTTPEMTEMLGDSNGVYVSPHISVRGMDAICEIIVSNTNEVTETVTLHNLRYVTAPEERADTVYISNQSPVTYPYVEDTSKIGVYVEDWTNFTDIAVFGYGVAGDSSFGYVEMPDFDSTIAVEGTDGQFVIEDGILKGFSITELYYDNGRTVEYLLDDLHDDYEILCLVPYKIGESEESGNDLGTTGVIMAVIPIFVVLAILIYAVQFLRTKPDYEVVE